MTYVTYTALHRSDFTFITSTDMLSNGLYAKKLQLGTTVIKNFSIFYSSYLIEICKISIFTIFTMFWQHKKGINFDLMNKKLTILYGLRCSLQNILMQFFSQTNFEFWTFWTRRFHSGSVWGGEFFFGRQCSKNFSNALRARRKIL